MSSLSLLLLLLFSFDIFWAIRTHFLCFKHKQYSLYVRKCQWHSPVTSRIRLRSNRWLITVLLTFNSTNLSNAISYILEFHWHYVWRFIHHYSSSSFYFRVHWDNIGFYIDRQFIFFVCVLNKYTYFIFARCRRIFISPYIFWKLVK